MDLSSPTTPTDTSGREAINNSSSRGMVVGDGTTDRVLIGFQKDGFGTGQDYGIKVSQDTYDVKTATDSELLMSSAFNTFKIVLSGTASLTVTDPLTTGATSTATIAHNLGFKPAYLAYVTVPSGSSFYNANQLQQLPVPLLGNLGAGVASGGALVWMYVKARVDNTNLYLDVLNPTAGNQTGFGNPWVFKYYILQETAA